MKKTAQFGNALHSFTVFFNDFVLEAVRGQPNTESEEPYRYMYTLLHKLNAGLDTCAYLVERIEDNQQFADSILILLRTLISDSMMFYHVVNKSKGKRNDMERLIKSLYFDHLEYTIKDAPFISKLKGITLQEAEAELHRVKMGHPEYYHGDGTPKVESWKTTVRGAMKFALLNPIDDMTRNNMQAQFHYYDFFSKYEHFGDMTFDLTHRQYRDMEKVVLEIATSIQCLLPTYLAAMNTWPNIKTQYEALMMDHIKQMLAFAF